MSQRTQRACATTPRRTDAPCGSADLGGISNAVYSPTFSGTFNGNVRDLTVRLHHLALSRARTGDAMDLQVHAEIERLPAPRHVGLGHRGPSGMTFNPDTPAAAMLKATLPQF